MMEKSEFMSHLKGGMGSQQTLNCRLAKFKSIFHSFYVLSPSRTLNPHLNCVTLLKKIKP